MSLIAKPTTKSTELLDKRQESSKTFDNQDNTFTVVSVLGPAHYKETYAENEDWLDIDPTHVVETPEYTFYDQMPIKVKVFKNKIGYEVEDRETTHKITVELDQIKPEGITFETKIHPCRIRFWKRLKVFRHKIFTLNIMKSLTK